jgi:hypothetical protein
MRVVRESKDSLTRSAWQRAYRESIRVQVFDHYGWTCACCGTAERPSIDHVNGGGREHREEVLGDPIANTYVFYRWLIANGFPEGFQTLCRPCNASKGPSKRCRLDHAKAA